MSLKEVSMNNCTHYHPGRWVRRMVEIDPWGTEEEQLVWEDGQSACVDISIGAFRCTLCGSVNYYTGSWRNYYEKGIPCFGSDGVSRILPR